MPTPYPETTAQPRTIATARAASIVAATSLGVGVPAAAIGAYLLSAYLHPGGKPLPADIASALGAAIAGVSTYVFHVARIGLAILEKKYIETP